MLVWDRTCRFPLTAPSEWLLLFPAAATKQLCPTSTETHCAEAGATLTARALQVQRTEGSHYACALIATEHNSHGLPPELSLQEYSDVKYFFFQRGMVCGTGL